MKFLMVDDHALIREALRGVLKELERGAIMYEASCWGEATQLLDEHSDLSLVLLDLGLPDRDGFAALTDVRTHYPMTPVAILSAHCDRDSVMKAFHLGAVGFLPKAGKREVMLSALRLILAGGVYIPDIFSKRAPPAPPDPASAPPSRSEGPVPTPADLGLTPRQVDVLSLMMYGKANKEICRMLDLAEPTVKNHVTAIFKALKVRNRVEAVVVVGSLGWELPRIKA